MKKDFNRDFTYHPPTPNKAKIYAILRAKGKDFALVCEKLCHDSREKSLCMTKIEEAIMWANAAIARNGDSN